MKDVQCIGVMYDNRFYLRHICPSSIAKKELNDFLEYYPASKSNNVKMIPVSELVTCPDTNLIGQIEQLLKSVYVENIEKIDNRIVISVSGDWKHDHLFVDHVVTTAFDLIKDKEITTSSDGSDTYKADHYYRIQA